MNRHYLILIPLILWLLTACRPPLTEAEQTPSHVLLATNSPTPTATATLPPTLTPTATATATPTPTPTQIALPVANGTPIPDLPYNSTSVVNEYAAVVNVIGQYVPGLLTGSMDPAEIPNFLAQLKAAGIDKIVAAKQQQLDQWLSSQR